jgi:hypothetical protein
MSGFTLNICVTMFKIRMLLASIPRMILMILHCFPIDPPNSLDQLITCPLTTSLPNNPQPNASPKTGTLLQSIINEEFKQIILTPSCCRRKINKL